MKLTSQECNPAEEKPVIKKITAKEIPAMHLAGDNQRPLDDTAHSQPATDLGPREPSGDLQPAPGGPPATGLGGKLSGTSGSSSPNVSSPKAPQSPQKGPAPGAPNYPSFSGGFPSNPGGPYGPPGAFQGPPGTFPDHPTAQFQGQNSPPSSFQPRPPVTQPNPYPQGAPPAASSHPFCMSGRQLILMSSFYLCQSVRRIIGSKAPLVPQRLFTDHF